MKVVKRTPSSFLRIESFLSSKSQTPLARGLSRRGSGSGNNLNTTTNGSISSSISSPRAGGGGGGDSPTTAAAGIPPASPGRVPSFGGHGGTSGGGSLAGLAASVGSLLLLGRSRGGDEKEGGGGVGAARQGSLSSLGGSSGSANESGAPVAPASPRVLEEQPQEQQEEEGEEEAAALAALAASVLALQGEADLAFPVRQAGYHCVHTLSFHHKCLIHPYIYINHQAPRTPTEAERQALQALARRLVIISGPAAAADDAAAAAGQTAPSAPFDLLADPRRALLLDGVVDKKGACDFCACLGWPTWHASIDHIGGIPIYRICTIPSTTLANSTSIAQITPQKRHRGPHQAHEPPAAPPLHRLAPRCRAAPRAGARGQGAGLRQAGTLYADESMEDTHRVMPLVPDTHRFIHLLI